ncbi:Histidine phosphatase superfamily (branch 2) [Popillia japonica]|uniref:Histidine phosphatase superfamily (Branch 2) n=1 Tax=Popillia japonica TaxID=7064 RepID=A0AAW1MIN6_POPJA
MLVDTISKSDFIRLVEFQTLACIIHVFELVVLIAECKQNQTSCEGTCLKRKSRKEVAIIAMTTAGSVFFVTLIVIGVSSSSSIDSRELLLVHVISRHGARTPVDTYPNDPYINTTFYPAGWGYLTNEGKRDAFNLGQDIRRRYNKFLGDFYTNDIYYSQSTDVDRTISSVQVMNAGIWEPRNGQKWGDLNWQPIPVHYEALNQDMLLLVRKMCPQYDIEFRRLMSSPMVQEKLKLNKDLFEYLEHWSGNRINNFDDVQDLYSTLYAEDSFNLTLPSWTINIYPDKLYELTSLSFQLRAYNNLLIRRYHQIGWSEDVLVGDGGHDSTIANLLSALKMFKPHVPDYTSTIILEFSRDRFTDEYGIEVYYKMSVHHQLQKMHIPNCDSFCLLKDFLRITADVVPENWEKECATDDPNFVPSEPIGP